MSKYEHLYRESRNVCGQPFQQVVEFFNAWRYGNCQVLDLGCGQGRDALFIAQKGHSVLGVDISETGISQMLAEAAKAGLRVEGVVADILEYKPNGQFDVVLLDRVLHLLGEQNGQISVLETACRHTKPGGFVLIADTPKNKSTIAKFFENKQEHWEKHLEDKSFLFVRRKVV